MFCIQFWWTIGAISALASWWQSVLPEVYKRAHRAAAVCGVGGKWRRCPPGCLVVCQHLYQAATAPDSRPHPIRPTSRCRGHPAPSSRQSRSLVLSAPRTFLLRSCARPSAATGHGIVAWRMPMQSSPRQVAGQQACPALQVGGCCAGRRRLGAIRRAITRASGGSPSGCTRQTHPAASGGGSTEVADCTHQ